MIAKTTKGHRVYLQGLCDIGWPVGAHYHVTYGEGELLLQLAPEGKRKVSSSKGGVIDLEGMRVTSWAQGSTSAMVVHGNGRIVISKN